MVVLFKQSEGQSISAKVLIQSLLHISNLYNNNTDK